MLFVVFNFLFRGHTHTIGRVWRLRFIYNEHFLCHFLSLHIPFGDKIALIVIKKEKNCSFHSIELVSFFIFHFVRHTFYARTADYAYVESPF